MVKFTHFRHLLVSLKRPENKDAVIASYAQLLITVTPQVVATGVFHRKVHVDEGAKQWEARILPSWESPAKTRPIRTKSSGKAISLLELLSSRSFSSCWRC